MRLNDVLSTYRGDSTSVIEFGEQAADLGALLQLPSDMRYERWTHVPLAALAADALAITMVGPDSRSPATDDALAALTRCLAIGGRALVIAAWPVEDLPVEDLCGPLADGGCQVVAAVSVDPVAALGATCALVVDRVERVVPVGTRFGPSADDGSKSDELRDGIYAASGFLVAEHVTRALRKRLREASAPPGLRPAAGSGIDQLEREFVREHAKARALQSRLDTLESSLRLRIGTMAVRAMHHPLRAVVDVPRELVHIGRLRREELRPARGLGAIFRKSSRTVPLALPKVGHGGTPLLTMTAPRQMFVPRTLARTGLAGYEPAALACYLAALDTVGPGAVLDVGANVGIYAALANAFSEREVRAFEPMPQLAAEARKFASDNGLAFQTESLALGAENGEATFYLSDSTDSSNSLAPGFRKSSKQLQVRVQTLDDYVAQTGIQPAIIKIDTETTEPDVLAGAIDTIAKSRPWILCEVLEGRRVEQRLTKVLAPFGYRFYHITDRIPYVQASEIVGDPTHEHLMWLFAPDRPGQDFWSTVRDMAAAIAVCTPARGVELYRQ